MTALSYDSFINPKTLAAVRADRLALYGDRACAFLRKSFPQRVKLLSDEALTALVLASYDRASRAGLQSEQDLFKHLIVVVMWGAEFASNPAFRAALHEAGWPSVTGDTTAARIHAVLRHVDLWHAAIARDLSPPKRIITGFQRLFKDGSTGTVDETQAEHWLRALWPNRVALMGQGDVATYVEFALARAAARRLTGVDAVAYVALGGYFGGLFERDPLHPWASEAYAMTTDESATQSDLEAHRLALGAGVQGHWALVQQEFQP